MTYSIRTQDGIVINNIPDDIPEDHPSLKQRVNRERIAMKVENDPISQGAKNFAKDMSFTDKFNAGMGKALTDLGRGAGQMVGLGPNAEEVRETKRLDAPLMKTGAGMAGNVAGNIAALAPLAVIPGGATVAGAGAAGMVSGALQPTETPQERLVNQGTGLALGAGTQFAGTTGARMLGERAVNKQAEVAAQQSRNAVRDATLKDANAAGYVVPPSAVSGSATSRVLESIAGKAAIGQEASIRNQEVTNKLARQALGLPDDAPITEAALKALRQTAGQPYRDVAALSPAAALSLENLKNARFQANAYQKHYSISADPKSLAEARNFAQQADQLEQSLEQAATQAGKADLVAALRDSRRQIAKTYEVEKALNVGTGDVSAKVLGRALDKGKPLSGELATAGRFAEAFGPYAREGASVPAPGVSKLAAITAALAGGGGTMAAGPVGMAAAAIPFAGPALARKGLLSGPVQDAIANPTYSAGGMTNATAALADPETRRRIALLARSLALPAIPEAVNQ